MREQVDKLRPNNHCSHPITPIRKSKHTHTHTPHTHPPTHNWYLVDYTLWRHTCQTGVSPLGFLSGDMLLALCVILRGV